MLQPSSSWLPQFSPSFRTQDSLARRLGAPCPSTWASDSATPSTGLGSHGSDHQVSWLSIGRNARGHRLERSSLARDWCWACRADILYKCRRSFVVSSCLAGQSCAVEHTISLAVDYCRLAANTAVSRHVDLVYMTCHFKSAGEYLSAAAGRRRCSRLDG